MLEFLSNLYNFIFPEHNGIIYAIDPLTIGLIAGGAQALMGGIQALGAGKRKEEPKYEIPQEVFQATKQAQEMAQTGMPEASRMMALQGAQQAAVQAGRRAEMAGRGALLGNISNIQAGLDRTNLSVAAQDASMRLQNQRFAQQALMTQAQYRDKAFANQWQSWMNREQQRRANIGAGMQNIARGISTAGTTALLGMQLDALSGNRTTSNVNLGSALTPATTTGQSQPLQFAASPTFDTSMLPATGGALPGSQTLTPPPFPFYGTGNLQSQAIFNSLIARPNR